MHHLRGHENVVQLKEVFEDKNNVHLVMELAAGGELFDHIVARGHYTCVPPSLPSLMSASLPLNDGETVEFGCDCRVLRQYEGKMCS